MLKQGKIKAHAMPRDKTMRIQIFTRPIHNGDVELKALNKFLVSHRVTDVHKAFIVTDYGVVWIFRKAV